MSQNSNVLEMSDTVGRCLFLSVVLNLTFIFYILRRVEIQPGVRYASMIRFVFVCFNSQRVIQIIKFLKGVSAEGENNA